MMEVPYLRRTLLFCRYVSLKDGETNQQTDIPQATVHRGDDPVGLGGLGYHVILVHRIPSTILEAH
jgi:hypothetical protein